MKRVLSFIFIALGIGVLFISTNKSLMQVISEKRNNDNGFWGTHHASGDLVHMSYLDAVARFNPDLPFVYKRPADTTNRNIDLYLYGDSYTVDIPDSAFAHVANYHVGRRDYTQILYKLDPTKKNILILENAERFVRVYLSHPYTQSNVRKDTAAATALWKTPSGPVYASLHIDLDTVFKNVGQLYNPNINPNLEYNLFNYNFINPIREMKAGLNYRLFNRASGDVIVADDGKSLFLKQTVAEGGDLSSYAKIDSQEINAIADTVMLMYQHFRKAGFDEVYFTVLPNPASVLQPKYYNNLVPELQRKWDSAGMPFINVYDIYKTHPDKHSLYLPGDTHWSPYGQQIWIQTVNKLLTEKSKTLSTH